MKEKLQALLNIDRDLTDEETEKVRNIITVQEILLIVGGICSSVVSCWTAGQQVELAFLHQGHES